MFVFFFFNDTATTEIYTLSLHDALPILGHAGLVFALPRAAAVCEQAAAPDERAPLGAASLSVEVFDAHVRVQLAQAVRSEEHTSELQSRQYLVCRLLLEKKKNTNTTDRV